MKHYVYHFVGNLNKFIFDNGNKQLKQIWQGS